MLRGDQGTNRLSTISFKSAMLKDGVDAAQQKRGIGIDERWLITTQKLHLPGYLRACCQDSAGAEPNKRPWSWKEEPTSKVSQTVHGFPQTPTVELPKKMVEVQTVDRQDNPRELPERKNLNALTYHSQFEA